MKKKSIVSSLSAVALIGALMFGNAAFAEEKTNVTSTDVVKVEATATSTTTVKSDDGAKTTSVEQSVKTKEVTNEAKQDGETSKDSGKKKEEVTSTSTKAEDKKATETKKEEAESKNKFADLKNDEAKALVLGLLLFLFACMVFVGKKMK